MTGGMEHPRDQKGVVSETAKHGTKDSSEKEGWHGKEYNELDASKVRGDLWKSTLMEREERTGSEHPRDEKMGGSLRKISR